MVQLQARATKDEIIISKDSFEHLLNCLDNQKYINSVNADAIGTMTVQEIRNSQDEMQSCIDDFNRQCRELWMSS